MYRAQEELAAAGGQLIMISHSPVKFMPEFREKTGYDGPLYTDPERRVHKALGLRSNLGSSMNLSTLRRGKEASKEGFRQSPTRGNPWQQGGVYILAPDGRVAFSYISQFAGDHPEIETLIFAVDKLARDIRVGRRRVRVAR